MYQTNPINTTIINGRVIKYGEGITNDVTVRLSFRDRIRVLFGQPIKVMVDTYIEETKATVLGSESRAYVERFRKSKPNQGAGTGMIPDNMNASEAARRAGYPGDTEQDRRRNGYYGIDNE